MGSFKNKDFTDFIESYRYGSYNDEYDRTHKFCDTVTELSRSDTERADPLIKNKQKMYGLDWIVKASNKFGDEPPKSTDALFFREDEYGNLILHLIEFKFIGKKSHWDKINILWHDVRKKIECPEVMEKLDSIEGVGENLDIGELFKTEDGNNDENSDCNDEECFDKYFVSDLKLIKKDFKDPIEISLQLKPYEVVFITLPKLYEEYCDNNPDVDRKDIVSFLNSIDKYYWTFVGNFSQSEYAIRRKTDRYNKYNKRLEMTIFKKACAKPKQKFNSTLKREILGNFDYEIY